MSEQKKSTEQNQATKQITELEQRVAEIRAKRNGAGEWKFRLRRILNTVFIVLGAAGVVQYYFQEGDHTKAFAMIGIALFLKVIDYMISYLG